MNESAEVVGRKSQLAEGSPFYDRYSKHFGGSVPPEEEADASQGVTNV